MNIFSFRYQVGQLAFLMDQKKDGEGGGGGGEDATAKALQQLADQNKSLLERIDKLEKSKAKKSKSDDDEESTDEDEDDADSDDELHTKAKKSAAKKDKETASTAAIEAALKFSLSAKDWLKTNAALLPKDIEGILVQADKETYGSAVEKDAAIKSGIIQSFFSIQSNMDLLTPGLKSALEDYLKLTKNGKQEKAQAMYAQVFEPAFEMLRRIKKAESLNNGEKNHTDVENAYRDRLIKGSRKHYLGEKSDA